MKWFLGPVFVLGFSRDWFGKCKYNENPNIVGFGTNMWSSLLLFFFVNQLHCQPLGKKCLASQGKGLPALPCKFPFKLSRDGKNHTSCTTELHPQGRHWCSTKLLADGRHKSGHWGYCQPECFDGNQPLDFSDDANHKSGKYLYNEMDGCGKSLRKWNQFDFCCLL